jgi:C4-dicarboxylate transporter DctM subunit
MRALFGWLPGGLGMAAVMSCMGFAAISGSSPVTLIAVGGIMYPAMAKARYPDGFSLGLVMTAGSLGCLVAPSLILTIYALAVTTAGSAKVEVEQMWMAAYVPAAALALILCLYCFVVGLRSGEREAFSFKRLSVAFREGIWSLALPLIVFFGIKGAGGADALFAPFQAGAVALGYALLVTTLVHRELSFAKLFETLGEAARLMGMLILIIILTFSLNQLFVEVDLHAKLTDFLTEVDLGPIGFLILVNVFLIVIGALMDSVSATILFAPIIAPIAVTTYGIDPVHFGIIFVVNMEIGYLAPPVATNLFVAAALFKKPFGQVARAIMPGLGLTTAALAIFMFVPTCSKGLPNYSEHGVGAIWESFPWDGERITWIHQEGEAKSNVGTITDTEAEKALADDKVDKLSDDQYYFGGSDGGVEEEGLDDDAGTDGDAGAEEEADEEEDDKYEGQTL